MRPVWVLLMMSVIALSGCAGEEAAADEAAADCEADCGDEETSTPLEDEETPVPGQEAPAEPTNETVAPVPNTPPTASLVPDMTEVEVAVSVSFAINGSDDDGDELFFSFDADGDGVEETNGSALPVTHVFSYSAAGTYEASLFVTDGNATAWQNVTITVAEGVPEIEDRGWYFFDPVTQMCDVKSYTDYGGAVYVSGMGGAGTWVMIETNMVPGLQAENNHPARDYPTPVGGFALDIPDCKDGDLVAV